MKKSLFPSFQNFPFQIFFNVLDDLKGIEGGGDIFFFTVLFWSVSVRRESMCHFPAFRKQCNFYQIQFMFENSATRMEL